MKFNLVVVEYDVFFFLLEQFDILEDGSVILQSGLDYELTSTYTLTISAMDSGFPSLSGTANLVINLIDANDNPPEFGGAQATFDTPEASCNRNTRH